MKPEDLEDDGLADGDEGDRARQHGHVAVRNPERDVQEAQHERERERRGGEDGIGDELLGATPVDRIHQARHRLCVI